ncbi:uncharacterized protein LOC117319013 [Pecten maximus]|uniref:uncharacterized protein LOC117319013 n=1 Tax=Pecten maximus TaxID=6579 RepID=UPI001458DC61|nr:uncharacterized protein LOC117319013 [Pecten maximus]
MATKDQSTPVLEKFDGHSNAKIWFGKFEKISRIKKWKDEEKAVQLCLYLKGTAEQWLYTLDEAVQDNYELLGNKFKERFFPKEAERPMKVQRFLSLKQEGQDVVAYVDLVQALGKDLQRKEEEILDIVINGLDDHVKAFVLGKEARTIEDVIKYGTMAGALSSQCYKKEDAGTIEALKQELAALRQEHELNKKLLDGLKPVNSVQRDRKQDSKEREQCCHCGEYWHVAKRCRFQNAVCYNCGRKGHIKAICRSLRRKNQKQNMNK